ncbi:MAG TPA: tyrosine-type recombinase/integrase [Terriglobales bacterium]
MITHIFPQDSHRYLSLPVLGPLMDGYAGWLQEQRYTWRSTRYELRMAAHAAAYLKRRAVRGIEDVSDQHLTACHALFRRKFPEEAGSVQVLARFLDESGCLKKSAAPILGPVDTLAAEFMAHLRAVRGYAPSTVQRQGQIAAEFLTWLKFKEAPDRLASLTPLDIEGFLQHLGRRMSRVGLQKPIATLRGFLRFLSAAGMAPAGLDGMIDTPRVYRQEQLPRSLPWSTVESFLSSINRDSAIGKRDYAIFSLIATYGLRACEIVALTLDDILWRNRLLRIRQSKTGHTLELPLTDAVGSAIHDYLAKVPRYGAYRQVFLRLKAPSGTLKPTAVIEAFQAWSSRSGLEIPFKGVHCLRHSYALHLLRRGLPLKTIGDLLGHCSPESTTVYLRLATEDLRTVALPVPSPACGHKKEGQ